MLAVFLVRSGNNYSPSACFFFVPVFVGGNMLITGLF